jgi:hypothetical protein
MPETKRKYESETLIDLSMRLKKTGADRPGSSRRSRKGALPFPPQPETDPARSPDVVMKLIDFIKDL